MAERSVAFDNMRRALLAYVQAIPFAAVVEVQAIAGALNIPARHAAYILSRISVDETDLCPWHRVVPRNGVFSGGTRSTPRTALQMALLRHEGVPFADDVRIGFIIAGMEAVELKLGQNVVGGRRDVVGLKFVVLAHGKLRTLDRDRRGLHGDEAVGRAGLAPRATARGRSVSEGPPGPAILSRDGKARAGVPARLDRVGWNGPPENSRPQGCLTESTPANALRAAHQNWDQHLPGEPEVLWDTLVGWDQDSRDALFAYVVSHGVNAVVELYSRRPRAIVHADKLAQTVDLDVSATGWTATADTFLGRVTKARILAAVAEAKGQRAADRIEHLKKGEMVEHAAELLAGTGWIPEAARRLWAISQPIHGTVAEAYLRNRGITDLRNCGSLRSVYGSVRPGPSPPPSARTGRGSARRPGG